MGKIKVTTNGTLGLYQETIGITSPSFNINSDVATNIAGPLTMTGALTAIAAPVLLRDIQELTTPIVGATGATTHDASLARIFVHSALAGDFTANFTNVGLTSGYATTLTLVLQQGATPRFPTMGTIDGTAVTFSWQGNITPVVTANRTDVVTFSVILSGATYLVYGQLVSF